jgi:hypothetical protein
MIGAGALLVSPALIMLLFAVAAALMHAGMLFRHRFLELFPGLIGDILCLVGKIRRLSLQLFGRGTRDFVGLRFQVAPCRRRFFARGA